jgi:hypothetical protein
MQPQLLVLLRLQQSGFDVEAAARAHVGGDLCHRAGAHPAAL